MAAAAATSSVVLTGANADQPDPGTATGEQKFERFPLETLFVPFSKLKYLRNTVIAKFS